MGTILRPSLILILALAAGILWPQPEPAEAAGVAAVAAGVHHTCALTTAGDLKCWGLGDDGRLGDGATTSRTSPVTVVDLGTSIAAVSAGGQHSCALTATGGVKCWGAGFAGQLGDGTTANRSSPVDVVGLASGVAAIAAGVHHTCALTTEGGVKCWGSNDVGQLGDGTTTNRTSPVDVVGLGGGVAAVAAGFQHTCAVTTEGGLKCWGENSGGRLGAETTETCVSDRLCSTTPVDVSTLTSGVAAVSAGGRHTCALTTVGGLVCWGNNDVGQLGDGTTIGRSTPPVDVSGLTSGVAAVAAGSWHTCALTTEGGLTCWGGNDTGQLGDGTTAQRLTPVDVSGLTSGVAAVAAAGEPTSPATGHTCALTTAGRLACWGANDIGQLGDGTTTMRTTPVDVAGLKPMRGDAGCDGNVNSIDATLVLQYVARLIVSVPCPENADANVDGTIDAVDAALILQYDAGLIGALPP